MICHLCAHSDTFAYCTKNGHELFKCRACGLIFVDPLPRAEDIYTSEYFEGAVHGFGYVDYDGDKEPMVPTFNEYLRRITKEGGRKGALLDVGAATGFFVNLAHKAGFQASGVEISDHAAAKGRSRGLDIETGTLAAVQGTFDVITMLDVIEHVPDPRSEIRRAASLLNSGGILVINTPDAGSLFARLLGKRWHLIVPPEHLHYFNRQNMRRLLEESGFSVREVTTIGKSFTASYILKTLYKWTKVHWFDVLAKKTARISFAIPLNLYDNMFILARKN